MGKGYLIGEQSLAKIKELIDAERGRPTNISPRPGQQRYSATAVPQINLARAYENIAAGSSGTVTIYIGAQGSETAGRQVTAYCRSRQLKTNDWCFIENHGRGWYVLSGPEAADTLVPFYLNDNIVRGGTASATILELSGGTWNATGATITVDDSYLEIGPASGATRGLAQFISGTYWVIQLDQQNASRIVWCKAQANWHNAMGNDSYVDCHLVTDKDGATEVLDADSNPIDARVYLPRPNRMQDPNVRSGKTIAAEVDANGDYVCVSDYLDDAIKTVKMWTGYDTDVGEGWRIYEPSILRFPIGCGSDSDISAATPGTTGGTKKHHHAASTTGATTLTIDPHVDYSTGPCYLMVSSMPAIAYPITPIIYGAGEVNTSDASLSVGGSGSINTGDSKANAGAGVAVANHAAKNTDPAGAFTASGTASGTTASNTTGISIADHAAHGHSITVNATVLITDGSGATTAIRGDGIGNTNNFGPQSHSITDGGHTHTFSGISTTISQPDHVHNISSYSHTVTDDPHHHTVSISSIASALSIADHNHQVDIGAIAAALTISPFTVTIPGWTPEIFPNPHIHSIPTMEHRITPNPHTHGIPQTDDVLHIPPFFGIYFIERYE